MARANARRTLWKHVNKAASGGCWEWSGNFNNKGYGVFATYQNNGRKKFLAHRYVLRLAGLLDESLVVMHGCDNPPCVNPAHLTQGTQTDNMRDAMAKGRMDMSGLIVGQLMAGTGPKLGSKNKPAGMSRNERELLTRVSRPGDAA